MLIALVSLILIFSLVLLAIRRDRRCFLIALTCLTLFSFIISILTYIAKKGGIGEEISMILYGTRSVRTAFQYRIMTLESLGNSVNISRHVFPLLLLLTALDMAYFDLALRIKKRMYLLFIIPVAVVVCYIPAVFKLITARQPDALGWLVGASRLYVYVYVAASIAVLVAEFMSITLPFFRRRFLSKSAILISLAIIYAFYAPQDPAQIYLFYRNDYMFILGLWFLSPVLSPFLYAFTLVGSVAFGILGFIFLLKYVRTNFDERREEITLRRSAGLASKGVGMFTHGTKNELLALGIVLSRVKERYPDDADVEKAIGTVRDLNARIERLHRASGSRFSTLSPLPLDDIIQDALHSVHNRYPDEEVIVTKTADGIMVLADRPNLAEAVANILMNAVEANREAHGSQPVSLEYGYERLWVSVRISDSGKGIDRMTLRNIWQPFWSSKNSSQNWGMGMYFSRNCVKRHLGSIRYERTQQGGSRFIILLPKLGTGSKGGGR